MQVSTVFALETMMLFGRSINPLMPARYFYFLHDVAIILKTSMVFW
jgi:hypothetical protein